MKLGVTFAIWARADHVGTLYAWHVRAEKVLTVFPAKCSQDRNAQTERLREFGQASSCMYECSTWHVHSSLISRRYI